MTPVPTARRSLFLATLALAACAGGPPQPKPWAETATRDLQLSLASLVVQGRPVSITRSAAAPAAAPVIVYLPGLGQGSQAHDSGQRWAAAWAQAGFTVLTVQPLETDAAAWRSELARSGEFRELGRLHYGEALRAERLAALRRLLPGLRAAQPGLDWARAALAGFETGAQTALDARGDPGWQAVIAISPPVMQPPTAGAAALLITSDMDQDPLGLVARPGERQQAFEALEPGNAWLLKLGNVSHAGLAGTLAPEGWHAQDQHAELLRVPRRSGVGQAGPAGPQGGVVIGPRSGSASEAARANLGEALRESTAFLNARLLGQPLDAARLKAR